MIQAEKEKFAEITKFLRANAEEIYDSAMIKHFELLGMKHVQEKKLETNKDELIAVITELANNLEDSMQGKGIFEGLGEKIAKKSIEHDLSIEEAVDGTIFLKQAFWEKLEQEGLLNALTVQEFYAFSSVIMTYCDIVTSNIVFTFHAASTDAEIANHRDSAERKRDEMDSAFLATMSESIRLSTNADKLLTDVTQMAGEYLQATRCYLAEVFEDENRWTIKCDYHAPLSSVAGEYHISDYDVEAVGMVLKGQTRVVEDTKTNPLTTRLYKKSYKPMSIRAFIAVPCRRSGRSAATLAIFADTPRQWHVREIRLVETIAERLWNGLEKIRSEQALRESEERFRMMADNIQNLAWIAQPDGYIYWYNKRWYDYTGTTPQDMEGWGWQSVHDPHELPRVLQLWNASIQSGELFNMVFPLKGADGLFRPFLTRVMPVKDTHGNVLHWFGTNTDISEQIKAEEALRKLSAQQEETLAVLESLLKNAPIGFAFFDTHHRYVRINDTLAEVNGINAEDHIGKTIEELLPETAKTVVPVLEKVMKTKEPILNLEVTGEAPKASGVTRYWLTSFYPVFIGKSRNVGFVGVVIVEITERKKLERQKDEFLAVASHELKTPVTSIKAYAQVLQRLFNKKGDMQSVEFLAKMDGQINKLITLIADLLDVSKMQAGNLPLRLNSFDFCELVTEIVDEIQRTTTHHTIRTGPIKSKMIYGDRDRIGQVITNLLTNAVKYSPHADSVDVNVHVDTETITLGVQDFGLGIPQEKQEKVFERFYRVEGRKENVYPGLGLGLYISSEIIRRHGGAIWVESVEGEGSTFFFTLPIQTRIVEQQEDGLDEEGILHE